MTHTSGLPDYEDLMKPDKPETWTGAHQIQDEEVLGLLRQQIAAKALLNNNPDKS